MSEMVEKIPRWQPAMIVLEGGTRLECKCGALAIIVSGRLVDNRYNHLEDVDVWCQECFFTAQERGE